MNLFGRKRNDTPALAQPDPAVADDGIMWRFVTQGGAVVVARQTSHSVHSYAWRCVGCDDSGTSHYETSIREKANEHASECWSMPKPEAAS